MSILVIIKYIVLSLAIVTIITPVIIILGNKYGFVQIPQNNRWNTNSVALLGGIGVFISIFINFVIWGILKEQSIIFIISLSMVFAVGLLDDCVTLRPIYKLLFQCAISCLMVFCGFRFPDTEPIFITYLISLIWYIGIINAINLIDNMDGLCCGISCIAAFFILINGYLSNNVDVILLSSLTLGACAGFLFFNFHPAKIFLGDCGSMALGLILATLTVMSNSKEAASLLYMLQFTIMILIVPIIDTTFVTVIRAKNKIPIYRGGTDHLSHKLVFGGKTEKNAVLSLMMVSITFGVLSLLINKLELYIHLTIILILLLAITSFCVSISRFTKKNTQQLRIKEKDWKLTKYINIILFICAYCFSFMFRYEFNLSENQLIILSKTFYLYIPIYFLTHKYTEPRKKEIITTYQVLMDTLRLNNIIQLTFLLIVMLLFRLDNYSRLVIINNWILSYLLLFGFRIIKILKQKI